MVTPFASIQRMSAYCLCPAEQSPFCLLLMQSAEVLSINTMPKGNSLLLIKIRLRAEPMCD